MIELLQQYVERFNENFPLFTLMGLDDKEIEAIIQKCLDDGQPYTPKEIDDKALY